MNAVKLCALAAVVVAGCAQSGSKRPTAAARREPGALALTVEYTTLCNDNRANSSCPSVTYPQVCWTGTCTADCGSTGEREFHVCAPGGTREDEPVRIEQRTSKAGLVEGTWQVQATTPSWSHECTTHVDARHEGSATVNSAWGTCS